MPAFSKKQRIAYIAGFFDGEGYVTLARANRYTNRTLSYRLKIGFTNKDLPVLQWIQGLYGGCINPKTRYSDKHCPAFELTIQNEEMLLNILWDIKPFVKIKNKQVDLGIAFLKLGKTRRSGIWPSFKALPSEIVERENFKKILTILNKRGVGTCLQLAENNVSP